MTEAPGSGFIPVTGEDCTLRPGMGLVALGVKRSPVQIRPARRRTPCSRGFLFLAAQLVALELLVVYWSNRVLSRVMIDMLAPVGVFPVRGRGSGSWATVVPVAVLHPAVLDRRC